MNPAGSVSKRAAPTDPGIGQAKARESSLAKEAKATGSSFSRIFGRRPSVVAFAPGRIEFIGNHTDYNGGPVLGAAIDRRVWIAFAGRADGRRRFASDHEGNGIHVENLGGGPIELQAGRKSWLNYPLGVLAALPAFDRELPGGFDYLVHSTLPPGAGLSSSAALELASALAFLEGTKQAHSKELVARIGLHAENNFVGVPCGYLDQAVAAFGEEDHLVWVDGVKLDTRLVALPRELRLWVFNTHTKHALSDGSYAARHQECRAAAEALGAIRLADATCEQLKRTLPELPENMVRRVQHVVGEIGRVENVLTALAQGDLPRVGRLLTTSHRSSQYLFENSTDELDFLVDRLVDSPGVFGARLSGGGFGGAVFALADTRFTAEASRQVAAAYELRFKAAPGILDLATGEGARVWQSS